MDVLYTELIKSYDIKCTNVKKFRGFYIITSNTSKFSLKKTENNELQLLFQIELQKKLEEAGMFNFEKIYETKDNKPCVCIGGVNYILTDYIEGGEVDFDKEEHLNAIIKALADFHKNSKGNYMDFSPKAEEMCKTAKKYYAELNAIKKKTNPSKGLSEFDILFLRNCDYYMNNAKICEEILNGGNYRQRYENAISGAMVCHNLLKRENLIIKEGSLWLASFSGCRLDYYTSDIAMLIERYFKYSKYKDFSPMDIVNKYSNYLPIDREDCRIILAAMLLPEAFVKISGQYYAKKRSWVPTSIVDKMESIVSTKATITEFLQPLFEIVK